MSFAVAVPWHNEEVFSSFCHAWGNPKSKWLFAEEDKKKEGCAIVKNRAIKRAVDSGAKYIIVLDSDCLPYEHQTIESFALDHIEALKPQPIEMFIAVTDPPSRGTPYRNRFIDMPVAASMGFWHGFPDYDAPASLCHGDDAMAFKTAPVYGRYFAFSGMNYAFHRDWGKYMIHQNVPRMDDIWMGLELQKAAYAKGYCFNLGGPTVIHSRQSNVWQNLRDEAQYLEENETRWQKVHKGEL